MFMNKHLFVRSNYYMHEVRRIMAVYLSSTAIVEMPGGIEKISFIISSDF